MEAKYYATCLWPGLPELWWRGRLASLPAAIAFALAVNFVLVTRYIYPHWLPAGLVSMAFWIGLVAWAIFVARSIRELPSLLIPRQVSDQPDRFPEAHAAFLAGNWSEAEATLTDVLAIEPRDPPALLLLTAVYRHTARYEAAQVLLDEIKRLEVAEAWWLEIESERKRLSRAVELSQQDSSGDKQEDEGPVTESAEKNSSEKQDGLAENRPKPTAADLAAAQRPAA